MSLQDRFRIDELTKVGSKVIPRDDSNGLVVRKVDNKEVPTPTTGEVKPYGTEPIKVKQVTPRTKEDIVQPQVVKNPEQTSFGGETAAFAERPIYNEQELQKAIDVKVDELIKAKKPKRGNFVRKEKYDAEVARVQQLNNELRNVKNQNSQLQGQVSSLESQISSLQSQVQSLQEEMIRKDEATQQLLQSFEQVVGDLQTAIINGTKEGVERASLAARVQGLGAQRDTLVSAVQSQNETIKTLRDNIDSQRAQFQGLLDAQAATIGALQSTNASISTIASDATTAISSLRNDFDNTSNQLKIELDQKVDEEKSGTFFGNLLRTLNPFKR